jgi:hypothetical protein
MQVVKTGMLCLLTTASRQNRQDVQHYLMIWIISLANAEAYNT